MRAFLLLLSLVALCSCLPVGEDLNSAIAVSPYITETKVVPDRSKTLSESPGRAVFMAGGLLKGHPTFTFYEITTNDDIEKLEAACRKALKENPQIKQITLLFYERQVWDSTPAGGGSRGHERLLKKVVVTR